MDDPKLAERPAKRPYAPPRLTCHGDVEELTQGRGGRGRVSDAPYLGRNARTVAFDFGS